MVSVEEASRIVLSNLFRPSIKTVDLNDAYGAVLGEAIKADRDFPPFNRVAMDGIAIWFSELSNGRKEFTIEGLQRAGQPSINLSDIGHAIEVMTGAVLPEGTNTVIRYEDLVIQQNVATVMTETVKEGHHVHEQGTDARAGDILLTPGMMLSPAEIALLASVGKTDVPILAFPKAAIISSGDELVEVNEVPESHQIRRSNTYAIQAAMRSIGWEGTQFHLHDQKDFVIESLKVIEAAHDVLIISGGVSKGRFDFIPEALAEIGVKKLVHQVSQRPGKPFWFGVSEQGKTVFALPGNPVSTYMCFYRYVMPWLYESLGVNAKKQYAILKDDFVFEPDMTYYLQVSIDNANGTLVATPEAGGGSGDFANLKKVDGFLELPKGRKLFPKGEAFPFWGFR
jgi:molybdopterin molybdotransferase